MNRCLALLIAAFVLLSAGQTSAVPTLTINGITQSTLVGDREDLSMTFGGPQQDWMLLGEVAGWKDVNTFGYFTDMTNPDFTSVFTGTDGMGWTMSTNIAEGTEVGLAMFADQDGDGAAGGTDPSLYSMRSFNANTTDADHQYFWVFDVSQYKGMGSEYVWTDDGTSFSYAGDYDYLIFVDDSGSGPDYDHNDMIIGVRSYGSPAAVPEPATIALFGLGLVGARLFRRK